MKRLPDLNKRVFFILFLILIGAAAFYVIKDYLATLILTLIIATVFSPVYEWFLKITKDREMLASVLTTLTVVLLFIIPFVLVLTLAALQGYELFQTLENSVASGEIDINQRVIDIRSFISRFSDHVDLAVLRERVDVISIVTKTLEAASNALAEGIIPAVTGGAKFIVNVVLFFFFLAFFFPIRKKILNYGADVSPFGDGVYERLVERFEAVTKGTVQSLLIIAVIQGFLGWFILMLLGFEGSIFWGVMMGFAAIIPLGSGLVYWPLGLFMLVQGNWVQGAVFLLWGNLVISSVDNIVRPKILESGEARLPEIVTLVSVVGGLAVFGFWGFIFGPVIWALFLTSLSILREYRIEPDSQDASPNTKRKKNESKGTESKKEDSKE